MQLLLFSRTVVFFLVFAVVLSLLLEERRARVTLRLSVYLSVFIVATCRSLPERKQPRADTGFDFR